MKIKKFWEKNEILNLSTEETSDIIEILQSAIEELDGKKQEIFSEKNKLMNFQNRDTKKNDQIDDAISNLELSLKSLSDSISKIDESLKLIKDYSENGRKYLY